MKLSYLVNDPLAKYSLQVLLKFQEENGCFVASPTFANYDFAWLRDGSFCALALFESGEFSAAERFNKWASSTILKHGDLFEKAIATLTTGELMKPENAPPTRFNLDGSVENDHHQVWPNYQIDGYGTWLAILEKISPQPDSEVLDAVTFVADFLTLSWDKPCFDCWEEGGDLIHCSTLLAVAGGLKSAFNLTHIQKYRIASEKILDLVRTDFIISGSFVKNKNIDRVDAALAWGNYPHEAIPADDLVLIRTIDNISKDLQGPNGGVMSYLGDSYYGGGQWILLEALIGINQAILGNKEEFEKSKKWISSCADEELNLPEQNLDVVQQINMVKTWEERWGKNASPLLWSHAMYLLLLKEGSKKSWL